MALDPERFRKWAKVATIGPLLAIAIFGGYFVGSWADGKLGSKPWGMLVGILLGTLGGFLETLRQVRETNDPGGPKGPAGGRTTGRGERDKP